MFHTVASLSDINISQGSVATRVRCGGLFHDDFTINSLRSLQMKEFRNRSTGTVHTSTKARLTSVVIWIRIQICDPDRHQNLIVCSSAHFQPLLQISCQSVRKFLRKVANRQTNNQRRKHNLLGGSNKQISPALLISALKHTQVRQQACKTHIPP